GELAIAAAGNPGGGATGSSSRPRRCSYGSADPPAGPAPGVRNEPGRWSRKRRGPASSAGEGERGPATNIVLPFREVRPPGASNRAGVIDDASIGATVGLPGENGVVGRCGIQGGSPRRAPGSAARVWRVQPAYRFGHDTCPALRPARADPS